MIPFYFLPANEKMQAYMELKENTPWYWTLATILKALSGPIYLVYSWMMVRKSRKKILEYFGNAEVVHLPWLRYLFISIAIIWTIFVLSSVSKLAFGFSDSQRIDQLVFLGVVIWIFAIGYYGLKQVPIFLHENGAAGGSRASYKIKYERNRIPPSKASDCYQRLLQLMQTEKPFLQPQVTLQDLAALLDVQPYELSQVLNDQCKQTFFEFVNGYRVAEVKLAMQDPSRNHLSLLGLALDSGFSSKTSFNRVFKKHEGITPSEYVKNKLEKR